MHYVRLGRSGLIVSSLAFGCMSFNDRWGLDRSTIDDLIRKALDAGVTLFDTANVYGSGGQAEVLLGESFKRLGVGRDDVVVASKVGLPMSPLPNGRGLGRKHVMAQVDASLTRLGVDYLDLYQIHRADPGTPIEETLDALDAVVRAGKVRYLGASSMFAWQLMKILGHCAANGLARFVSIQNYYNLLYREEEREMIPLCLDQGLGCLVWSPLARGRLARTGETQRSTTAREDIVNPHDDAIIARVREVAAERGVAPATVALAWLLAKPGVAAPIMGMSRPEQIDDALAAMDFTLSAEEVTRLEEPYRPVAVQGIDIPMLRGEPWNWR